MNRLLIPGRDAGAVPSHSRIFRSGEALPLDCGRHLASFEIAYQTYGTLNAARSNAVLVCHALTGDQHVASRHPVTGKPGWWETIVGPGKPVDTDRYFVICSNVLGGCMGSTGPASIDPATGKPYGLDFPVITIDDMVRAQARLIDHLGIADLFCVIGGSMGGMQVLEWCASFGDRVFSAVPVAAAPRHSSQNIAFHEVGRQAVMADPEWCGGRYLEEGTNPSKGLAVARMAAHMANAFTGTKTRFCVVSFTSDWLYPTRESRAIVQALNAVAANVSFVEIESDKGHDAFLLHEPELFDTIRGFLGSAAERRGLPAAPDGGAE
ncbi:MAG: homoserine O-acetyltransferase [Rhodomicrobium sp.]|nr:homoserine O-acetyltransferase [Rhodomicrobium sp.]